MTYDEPPHEGSIWRHDKTGGHYVVLGGCRLEVDGEPAVLYEPAGGGTRWVRPESEFMDGRFQPVDLQPGSSHDDDLP